jgi:glycosyltransferase involved in cell wall biosynthesis
LVKILFILHYYPPIHGAAMVGHYIRESKMINTAFDARYINISTSVSVDEIGKGGIKKLFRYVRILCLSFWQGLFWRPNLVYITLSSHGPGLFKDSLVVIICRVLRLKVVYHFHNKGVKRYAQTKIGKRMYPFIFKNTEIILLSPLLYEDIAAYVPENRIHFCANGIPDLQFPINIVAFDVDQPIRLLFLSNLIKNKGILDLIEACKLLKQEEFNFHCTIAGGEGDIIVSELKELIDMCELSAHITYLGKVQGDQKMKALLAADIFIHPTHEDCFPLVLLEAMQAGLSIIATCEGAIPEIVEDKKSGFIIPSHKPQLLAEAIKELAENPDLLIQMGKLGRKKYEENYTLEMFEKRYLQSIQTIIGTNT